ncbi:MAG: MlaD family protein [Pseudomonadota bacterium]
MIDDEVEQPILEPVSSNRFSWIWLVPMLVILVAGWVVYQSYVDRGVAVEIFFSEGKGIEAGKTSVRYKDVTVGTVESLRLSESLNGVVASVRLDRRIEPYLGETTDFWVVTANVSGGRLSGLDTLLSGAYIEMDWSETPAESQRRFEGLLDPPLTPPSADGSHFSVRSADSRSVQVGSPIMYRGIQIGQVERRDLDLDFRQIEYRLFIEAPYDSLINDGTRFYDVSGVSLALTGEGFELEIESLETLAIGGITFYTPQQSLERSVSEDRVFSLFNSRREAEESQFEDPNAPHYYFSAVFEGGVEGLAPGAPVVWQGVRLGTVIDLELDLGATPGDTRQIVVLDMQPTRVGLDSGSVSQEQAVTDFSNWIEQGMRVEIVTSNILSGAKRLQLVERPDLPLEKLDMNALPYPRIPTVTSEFGAVTKNVSQLSASLAELPYEQLMQSAIELLDNASVLLGSKDTQALPTNLNEAVVSIEALAAGLSTTVAEGELALSGLSPESPLYVELLRTIRELRSAAKSVNELTTLLEENPNALLTGDR